MFAELLEQISLVSVASRSLILLVLTLVVALAFRKRSAAVLHGIWTLGVVGCLVIPVLTWLAPNWSLPLLPPQQDTVARALNTARDSIAVRADSAAKVRLTGNEQVVLEHAGDAAPHLNKSPVLKNRALQDGPSRAVAFDPNIDAASPKWRVLSSVVSVIWLLGTLVIISRIVLQLFAMHLCVRRGREICCPSWLAQRDNVAQMLGVRPMVALKSHTATLSPMVAGLLRPVVLLPSEAQNWSVERQRLVLLHELAHVQRHDVLTQTLAALACAMHWFNPLAWWGANQMKRMREIACDDAVITHSKVPANYAQTLLDIAKSYGYQSLIGTVAMARTSNVETRIAAILSSTRSRELLTRRTAQAFTAAALVAAAIVGTCQLSSRAEDAKDEKTEQKSAAAGSDEARTMSVRVVDDQNKPLSSARVFVSIWDMEGGREKFPNHAYSTDSEGVAKISIPRKLRILRLWPSHEGYVPQFLNFGEGTHDEGRNIPDQYEFRLRKGHELSGLIVDADGKAIAGARVQVAVNVDEPGWGPNPDPMISRWLAEDESAPVTDAAGRWRIGNAPGPRDKNDYEFQLQITHPDYAGDTKWGEIQQQQSIKTAALRDGTATIKLDQGVAITGLVTGPDSKPVPKGLVVWSDNPYLATGVNETEIDAAGKYKTKRLVPGNYPLTVLAPGFAPTQQTVKVTRELGAVDIQLQAGNTIRIKIVDQAGNPIPKAYIGIGKWRGTEAIFNEKHPNVPDSGIPRNANVDGIYEWPWAPSDAVQYRISAKGYDAKEVTLVAKPESHQIELVAPPKIFGKVIDAKTRSPLTRFRVIPVKAFRPDFYSTDFQANAIAEGKDGKYELQIDSNGQTGNQYRVRIEAEGYRTELGQKSLAVGDPALEEDFQLQPAPASVGEVRDTEGKPANNFMVVVGTPTTSPHFSIDRPDSSFGIAFRVRDSSHFQLAETFEPQRIRVYNDQGFVEALRQSGEPIGTLQLQPWAILSGRLLQGDKPIGGEGVYFRPLENRELTEARFQDSFYVKTDANGNFHFDKLPPITGRVSAYLGPWEDSVLTSSPSVPIELTPGTHQKLELSGDGGTITGRVVATGRSNEGLNKNWSLSYLVSRTDGVDVSKDQSFSFDAAGPLKAAWLRLPDFQSWLQSRTNHFVKLAADGQFKIHGVQPGEYDLVIQLYEEPAGCLVETIGEKVIPITVTSEQASTGEMAIGDVDVECRSGPRIGSDMRAFKFTDGAGEVRHVDDLKGRYVLFHAWATWCLPCMEAMPELKAAVEKHGDRPLTVVGLNIDAAPEVAKSLAKSRGWNWAQNYLGDDSELMRQLAISTVPAYYLIGADGKLVGSSNQWEQIEKLLDAELK